jgi:hypothetical protein
MRTDKTVFFPSANPLHLSMGVLAVVMLLVSGTPAMGQVSSPDESQHFRDRPSEAEGPTHSSQLPDWAEPADPSSRSSDRKSSIDGEMRTHAPQPPSNPSRVPVDGGVALLAAAGAGYAVRKLSQDDEEDDEPA